MIADEINVKVRNNKCPEVQIMLNGVHIKALVDTGNQVNAVSERCLMIIKELGKLEILKLSNTVVKGATGNKSKKITQQVLLIVQIGSLEFECFYNRTGTDKRMYIRRGTIIGEWLCDQPE